MKRNPGAHYLSLLQKRHHLPSQYTPLCSSTLRLVSTSPRQHKPASSAPSANLSSGHDKLLHDAPPLSILPLRAILRSYAIMAMSSSPRLLSLCTKSLSAMLQTSTSALDVQKNPIINRILMQTFYAQFCAGETQPEVRRFLADMHRIGYHGLILEYAREILDEGGGKSEEDAERDIEEWGEGLLDTVKMVNEGDFVGLKWSGMGPAALKLMKKDQPPSPSMGKAMDDLCDAAASKGVMLLPAAEPQNAQRAVDAWTLRQARRYNKKGHAVVYNTYQSYLKSTPKTLSQHLALAAQKDFTLGVKLVRGAYLGTEQRDLIHDTKQDTDNAYNSIATTLLQQKFEGLVQRLGKGEERFPSINLVLATHNLESVELVRALRNAQKASGTPMIKLSYAQLQGMADEISCLLVKAQIQVQEGGDNGAVDGNGAVEAPKVFKCVTWGEMKDCLHYLLRRANENRDAMARTEMTRRAMGGELRRRFWGILGLARS